MIRADFDKYPFLWQIDSQLLAAVISELSREPAASFVEWVECTVRWWNEWKIRHQHPVSLVLHGIGIPLTLCALVLAGVQLYHGQWSLWWRPAVFFLAGYMLQWIGHKIEGNTMGELILVRKWRGKPYTAIAPKYQKNRPPT